MPATGRSLQRKARGGLLCMILFVQCTAGAHGTIGAILAREQAGRTFVRDAPEHLAAFEAGIRPGDELLFVNGLEVKTLSDEELHDQLSGAVGQEVQLTLARGGHEILRLSVRRSPAEPYRHP